MEILTPRGEVAVCFIVRHTGQFGYAHVYGADEGEPPIAGFRDGEPLAFRVDGLAATASQELTWSHDMMPQAVDLALSIYDVYLPLIVRE